MRSYPYTIDNGAGERLTFQRLVPTARGGRVEGENVVSPGAGPPMHVHYLQDEGFTVVHGRLGVQRPGAAPEFAGAGETVVFLAGEPHRFWNAGDGELRCAGFMEPAGNAEFFLEALFDFQRANGGARPSLFDVAFLTRRYRAEFGMLEIPAVVQRLLFPLIVAVGRKLGRYDKYANAPEPMRAGRG
jgi:quercetin dioxygenase-like cupin family protein